ncbi:MAG TPA: spore coat protein U domain-containing protein [Allosphingosinicella sp.]|nr:spore coat protein U domain-containing protein [Allosphingosinicella sp.]
MNKLAIMIAGAAASSVLAIADPASAQVPTQFATQTTTFLVTANVTVSCTIAANNLVFGDYNPAGGALTAQGQIQVHCTNSAAWNIGIYPLAPSKEMWHTIGHEHESPHPSPVPRAVSDRGGVPRTPDADPLRHPA